MAGGGQGWHKTLPTADYRLSLYPMSFVGKWYGFGHSANYDAGIRAREKGETAAAVELFRLALNDPVDPALKKVIGRTLANALGRLAKEVFDSAPAEASSLLEEGLAMEPEFADLWLWKARCSRALGFSDSEGREVNKALDINPKYGEALLHQAALLCAQGKWQEAMVHLDLVIETSPRLAGPDAQTASRLIEAHSPEAESRLLAIRPRDPRIYAIVDEGDYCGLKRQWSKAEALFREALEIAPSYADIRFRLAQALMELGRMDEADLELVKTLALNPRYAEAIAVRGVLKRRLGQEEEAMAFFREALEADPSQPIAREELRRGPRL